MSIVNDFYTLASESIKDEVSVFEIELDASHPVYKGHFPDHPIVPGVFQLEILKDCAGRIVEQPLFFSRITSCKFVSPILPADNKHLTIELSVSGREDSAYDLQGVIRNEKDTFLKIKAILAEKI